ncbi:MAG: helix-turn-helix domain-containing protein [Rickettsiaceae bacterium]|nr:helix-turn-helix domain-containing protein [Rickettsiaceae bacterium]
MIENIKSKIHTKSDSAYKSISMNEVFTQILKRYFSILDGASPPEGLYHKIISEVESILISETLKYTGNNQVQASQILGINRNTLRKKLQANLLNEKSSKN